jgi:hypothetical protein
LNALGDFDDLIGGKEAIDHESEAVAWNQWHRTI